MRVNDSPERNPSLGKGSFWRGLYLKRTTQQEHKREESICAVHYLAWPKNQSGTDDAAYHEQNTTRRQHWTNPMKRHARNHQHQDA